MRKEPQKPRTPEEISAEFPDRHLTVFSATPPLTGADRFEAREELATVGISEIYKRIPGILVASDLGIYYEGHNLEVWTVDPGFIWNKLYPHREITDAFFGTNHPGEMSPTLVMDAYIPLPVYVIQEPSEDTHLVMGGGWFLAEQFEQLIDRYGFKTIIGTELKSGSKPLKDKRYRVIPDNEVFDAMRLIDILMYYKKTYEMGIDEQHEFWRKAKLSTRIPSGKSFDQIAREVTGRNP